MYFNKESFMASELGCSLDSCIRLLDSYLIQLSRYPYGSNIYAYEKKCVDKCFAQWAVYKIAIKYFCGIEYNFTRTDEYFGLVTEDETDWLIKIER